MAATLVALLIAAAVYLGTYDPICGGPCGGVGGVHGSTVSNLGHYTSPHWEDFTAYRIQHVPGRRFAYWFTVWNQGRFGVTIVDIGADPPSEEPFVVDRVQLEPDGGTGGLLIPFRPFSLAPHSFMNVLVTLSMRGCLAAGNATGFGSVPLSYQVLGVTHTTTAFLPEFMEVTGRAGVRCP